MIVSNPVALLVWAISVGRVPAKDYALWLGRLTGEGREDYMNQLIYGQTRPIPFA